jgi:DNA-binding NarL/FixJ family response regulator
MGSPRATGREQGKMSRLATRQRQLVALLMTGLTRKEAASEMGISHSMAKNFACRARRKLDCRTVEQMMYRLGYEAGAATAQQKRKQP